MAPWALFNGYRWSSAMSQHFRFDASRSLTALEQDSTIVAVIEMSQTKWLVAALVPGVERQPLKKFDAQEEMLLKLLHRWHCEAGQAGRNIKRIVVAFEAGRDGFRLARWLRARDVEAYVIHPTSIAVSREHRRAKTDRLDTELLMRVFLGWLRGEKRHCSMVAIPTIEEEDARRPNRERQNLVTEQTRIINQIKAIFTRFGKLAHGGRHVVATEHAFGTAPSSRAATLRTRPDPCGRTGTPAQARGGSSCGDEKPGRDGPPDCPCLWRRYRNGGHAGQRDLLAPLARSQGRRPLRRSYRLARRERQPSTRTGSCARRQCPRPLRHDSAGLAFCQVPKEQRPGPMVRGANRRRTRQHTQDDDRGAGA